MPEDNLVTLYNRFCSHGDVYVCLSLSLCLCLCLSVSLRVRGLYLYTDVLCLVSYVMWIAALDSLGVL